MLTKLFWDFFNRPPAHRANGLEDVPQPATRRRVLLAPNLRVRVEETPGVESTPPAHRSLVSRLYRNLGHSASPREGYVAGRTRTCDLGAPLLYPLSYRRISWGRPRKTRPSHEEFYISHSRINLHTHYTPSTPPTQYPSEKFPETHQPPRCAGTNTCYT